MRRFEEALGWALVEVRVQIAFVVPFIAMKGIAMEDRRKAKDACDIDFVLHNYPGGVDEVVKSFRPHLNDSSKPASKPSSAPRPLTAWVWPTDRASRQWFAGSLDKGRVVA
jgi:hypothetical protein